MATLRKAADVYFDNASNKEIDLDYEGCEGGISDSWDALESDLATHIIHFEQGDLPKAQVADFMAADNALNATYRRLITRLPATTEQGNNCGGDHVTSTGVKETQRSWLAYREAWVKFGASRYPNVAADAWRAWLSIERTRALNDIGTQGGG